MQSLSNSHVPSLPPKHLPVVSCLYGQPECRAKVSNSRARWGNPGKQGRKGGVSLPKPGLHSPTLLHHRFVGGTRPSAAPSTSRPRSLSSPGCGSVCSFWSVCYTGKTSTTTLPKKQVHIWRSVTVLFVPQGRAFGLCPLHLQTPSKATCGMARAANPHCVMQQAFGE